MFQKWRTKSRFTRPCELGGVFGSCCCVFMASLFVLCGVWRLIQPWCCGCCWCGLILLAAEYPHPPPFQTATSAPSRLLLTDLLPTDPSQTLLLPQDGFLVALPSFLTRLMVELLGRHLPLSSAYPGLLIYLLGPVFVWIVFPGEGCLSRRRFSCLGTFVSESKRF